MGVTMYGNNRFKAGDLVFAALADNRWVPGTVVGINPNGMYKIALLGRGPKPLEERHLRPDGQIRRRKSPDADPSP